MDKTTDGAEEPALSDFTPSLLQAHKIASLPSEMIYISTFVTPSERSHIFSSLPASKWTVLSHRRLQAHPSVLSKSNTLLASPLPKWLTEPCLPRFKRLELFEGSPHGIANHCLINEYLPGQGIMPHEDGGAYFGCTATVSLGGYTVLDIYEKKPHSIFSESDGDEAAQNDESARKKPRWRILQEPGSLLVTRGEIYHSTLHGIAEVETDEDLNAETVANWRLLDENTRAKIESGGGTLQRGTRTSLTFRDVIKVSDVGNRILGFGKR